MNQRPAPRQGLYEDAFWLQLQGRVLRLQRCSACGDAWYPAGPVCPTCLSEEWAWSPMAGTGKAVAWTTFHRQYFKQLPPPYAVLSAALDEGPLIVADFAGDASTLAPGLPVKLEFIEVEIGGAPRWIYRWVPAS